MTHPRQKVSRQEMHHRAPHLADDGNLPSSHWVGPAPDVISVGVGGSHLLVGDEGKHICEKKNQARRE
jgi:hypothetical protein